MSWLLKRDTWIGDPAKYNYGSLCRPQNPFSKKSNETPVHFYGKDEPLPIVLSAIMGLQHAFAMVGGLITPGLVVFRFTINFTDVQAQQYIIAAALITSGVCTILNILKLPIPGTASIFGRQLYLGSGILSVMGTSFTFLPVFQTSIQQMVADGVDPYDAYGKMLGTSMVCGLLELILSIFPIKVLKGLFPPVVASITVMLLGVALTGTGMKYWGGGVVCSEMIWKEHEQVVEFVGDEVSAIPSPICTNGEVRLGYGSPEFIGLGFSVMVFLVFIELFGSVFMKNCNVVLALMFGYFVASMSDYEGLNYVDTSKIHEADPITFVWTETFKLGFYGPAVIPLLIAYLVTTTETVGDISATFEVSKLDSKSQEFNESLQGGLTSDSICSILAGLFTVMPNTTFSQNNGVIALTRCASRRAGYACGCWLIFLGVFSKVAGVFTSIPDCVLGGMTIFLWANVLVAGISLASQLDIDSRRVKFIMALSMAIGVGVTVWPFAFQDMRASSYTANFWKCEDCSDGMRGIRNGVSIFLSTGYCVGTIVAMLLNFILPEDSRVVDAEKVIEEEDDSSVSELDEGGSSSSAVPEEQDIENVASHEDDLMVAEA